MKKQKPFLLIILLIIFATLFTGCLAKPNTAPYYVKHEGAYQRFSPLLNFGKKDVYRILQMTDIQFIEAEISPKGIAVMDKLIEESKPDLIVITGDISSPEMFINDAASVKAVNLAVRDYFDSKKIAWTLVFGNHDGLMKDVNGQNWKQYIFNECYKTAEYFVGGDDSLSQNTKNTQYLKQSKDICEIYYGNDDPKISDQYFNFSIYIKDGNNLVFTLMGLDTGTCANAELNNGTYVPLTESQAEFYKNSCYLKADGTKASNKAEAVPTLLFTHQPLNMYNTMFLNRMDTAVVRDYAGEILDSETASAPNGICSPRIGYETFENVMLEYKNITGVFVGHDHVNTLAGFYKPADDYEVLLAYGRISSFGLPFYPTADFVRGGRVIDLEKDGTFSTFDARCRLLSSIDGNYVFDYEEEDLI